MAQSNRQRLLLLYQSRQNKNAQRPLQIRAPGSTGYEEKAVVNYSHGQIECSTVLLWEFIAKFGTVGKHSANHIISARFRNFADCGDLQTSRMSFVGPSSSFDPLFAFLSFSLLKVEAAFYSLPGSSVIARYVKSSHQNDPGRTVLELILVVFAIRTLLQSRTRNEKQQKHFIEFDEKVCTASVYC